MEYSKWQQFVCVQQALLNYIGQCVICMLFDQDNTVHLGHEKNYLELKH